MNAPTITQARPYMAGLADGLTRSGAIRTPVWSQAFSSVPRHLFVPRWFRQETNDRGIAVWREHHGVTTADDLSAVYRDQTLVTALDPDTAEQVDGTAWTGIPTSSSTLPSLMAGMLEDLAVQDGDRVLEIGTGTGYNAALLSARLGEHLVHSVDIDPDLVRTAQDHLSSAGFTPQLVPGDGTRGYPTGDRFDRIIATCAVPAVPAAWIEQSRPGTILVADVALGIEEGSSAWRSTSRAAPSATSPRPPADSWQPAARPARTQCRNGPSALPRWARGRRPSPPQTCAATTPSACSSPCTCPEQRSCTTSTNPVPWLSRSRELTGRGPGCLSPATP